jgi:predicted Zn-dependent peptidase
VRRFRLYIVALIAIVMLTNQSAARADDECAVSVRKVLDCGLEVVVYSDPSLEGQATQVWTRIGRGSMSERDDERGASMLAARAAMHGVGEFTRERLLEMIGIDLTDAGGDGVDDRGGVMVQNDHVSFLFEVEDGRDVEDAMHVARGLLEGYSPGEEAIEIARAGMLKELKMLSEERGERWAYSQWLPDLLDGSGYSRMAMPSVEQCESIDAKTVRAFVEREWNAGQSSLLVVGDVDAEDVIERAMVVFDGCAQGEATALSVVPIVKESVVGRVATIGVDTLDGSRLGLVWFGQEQTIDWEDDGYELALEMSLTSEAMRYRVNRMLRTEFPSVVDARVDVGMLMGRVPFGQIVVEMRSGSGDEWVDVLGTMERERVRMVRDGLSEEEIERAREWVDQQWGYEIDQWDGSTSRERARSLNWILSAGRPVEVFEDWVHEGRELLGDIGVEDAHDVVDLIFGGLDPAAVVVLDEEPAPEHGEVRRVLSEARSSEIEPLTGWMADLRGPILNRSMAGGEVEEIRVHRESGVVSAGLSNGVVVRHREMDSVQDDHSVMMVVRLGFDSIEDESMHGAGDVFVSAIEQGAIRSRTNEEIRAVMIEHGIDLEVVRGTWGVEFHVKVSEAGPSDGSESFERAVELVYAMLTDVRIEQEQIEQVGRRGKDGSRLIGVPIGAMETGIARSFGIRHTLRDPERFGDEVDARSVREWINRQVRGDRIEIGIAGPIEAEHAIEVCAMYLGAIDGGAGKDENPLDTIEFDVIAGQDTVRMVDPNGREGVVIGFGACRIDELDDLRALTVAGMVLDDRLEAVVALMGNGVRVQSGALLLDLVPGRVVMFGRVDCASESIDEWGGIVEDEITRMAIEGIGADEVRAAQKRIDSVITQGFERADFWASRLALIGDRGGDVDSIWSMPSAYRGLEADEVSRVFRRWHQEGEYIRVELVGEAR